VVFDPIQSDSRDARHIGYPADRMDGVIDDSFSLEYAYAGPVQHDGGSAATAHQAGSVTGLAVFLREYTRITGGKMMHPREAGGATTTSCYTDDYSPNGVTCAHSGQSFQSSDADSTTTAKRFGYNAWLAPAGNKPVTVIIYDSGTAYQHSEFKMGRLGHGSS
jgi:hypothetical protein